MQRDRLLVGEMIEAVTRAIELVDGCTLDQLEADRDRRDALLWNFTVLGEAASQVSEDLRHHHAEIAWRRPADLRNRIVHGYWSIDLSILHTTTADDLPAFRDQLRVVLATLDQLDAAAPDPADEPGLPNR